MTIDRTVTKGEEGWVAVRQKAEDENWEVHDDATMRKDGYEIYFGDNRTLELSFKHPESRERVNVINLENIPRQLPHFYAIFISLLEHAPELIQRYQEQNEMIK